MFSPYLPRNNNESVNYFEKLVILGDSVTQYGYTPGGYCAELANFYQRRLIVEPWGLSGYTSRHFLRYFSKLPIDIDHTRIVIIYLGTNDSQIVDGKCLCPVEEYKENIKELARKFPKTSKKIFVSPSITTKVLRYERNQEPYVEATYKAAVEMDSEIGDTTWIDMHSATKYNLVPELLFSDGVHLSAMGYNILFQQIVSKITTLWPQLLPKHLPMQLPYYREIMFT
ncbi:isoamyl acetate hydrolytic enzyme Iah1 [Schizosaccharomyces cryophilus OY26]|uniref:Isoamyl acetate hydrolytic enzyme Iah1 n=1 Tax=Schizosaccharomyces cryophilus (strain OY26 / ATCC MYA-4695 / CBS 11777 / NBRC 106824 / NRRL Y48691) TaxID=653667 RepID=S9VTR4_SCHCR|nr:isoamyl acetate hydrolytic enzyme Iah1 [Schizosaccharomyces cryophilus OY26]EPY51268.1 isoamyl acetate hydrolytic enzyme Iah1 [Schizosaccharomyces cryophilus OY26]